MKNLTRIAGITIKDQMRQKSFFLLLALSVAFVFLIRSCYQGDYSINGRQVEGFSVAWHASLVAFHVIAAGMFLVASMLSMGIFSRDREDGGMVMFLSRPVGRWQYLFGRMAGIWILSSAFMVILHLTIFLIALAETRQVISGYPAASLMCCVNLLFVIALTCCLSLFLPNVMAALFSLVIVAVSFISDGAYQVMQYEWFREIMSTDGPISLWRILFPKVYMLQHYAATSITENAFTGLPPVYVWANIVFYTVTLAAAALWRFGRSEI